MAFGTGEHATTATCLRLLTDIAADLLPNFSALDLGTGAGILAIAAKALGAGRVEAVDYDPIAVRIARHNASVNGFPTIRISQGDVLKLNARKRYDVVLANLFSDVLAKAAPRIARATKPGGWLVFSGVLRGQMGDVSDAIQAAGFARARVVAHGKWRAASCQRPGLISDRPRPTRCTSDRRLAPPPHSEIALNSLLRIAKPDGRRFAGQMRASDLRSF
jgi:ribosomal protein L11 methyltransferase